MVVISRTRGINEIGSFKNGTVNESRENRTSFEIYRHIMGKAKNRDKEYMRHWIITRFEAEVKNEVNRD